MEKFSPKQPIHSTYSTEVSKIAWVSLFIGSGSSGRSEWIAKHIRIFFFGAIIAWERLKWIIQFKGIGRIQFVDRSFPWIKIIIINSTSKYGKHKHTKTWTRSIKELGVGDGGECLRCIRNVVLNGHINSLASNFSQTHIHSDLSNTFQLYVSKWKNSKGGGGILFLPRE